MQPAVFERTSYYTSLFQKSKPFFHIFVRFLCGRGHLPPEQPDSRSRGSPLLPPQAARPQVSGDEHGAPEYQQKQNQRGAVPEKASGRKRMMGSVRQSKSQLVSSREKQSMEHHKGPLEVQGRQTAHREKDRRQSGSRPRSRDRAPEGRQGISFFLRPTANRTARTSAERTSTPRSSRKRARTSAKWAAPSGEAGRTPAAKVGAQSQAVIHHLPISPADLPPPAGRTGSAPGGNVGVIEGRHRMGAATEADSTSRAVARADKMQRSLLDFMGSPQKRISWTGIIPQTGAAHKGRQM